MGKGKKSGNAAAILATLGLLPATNGGCAANVTQEARYKASQEYRCPYQAIKLQKVGDDRYRASGCMQEGIYECNASGALGRPVTCNRVADDATPAPASSAL